MRRFAKPFWGLKPPTGVRIPPSPPYHKHSMFMRVCAPCYYFSYDSADLIYTFSQSSRTWNYTILKKPDRPENRWVLVTRFLCGVLSRRPQVANRVTPLLHYPDSGGGLENLHLVRSCANVSTTV